MKANLFSEIGVAHYLLTENIIPINNKFLNRNTYNDYVISFSLLNGMQF